MNIGWKIITMGISGIAGAVANVAVNQIWEKGLGKHRPADEEEMMRMSTRDLVIFTGVSAIVTAVVSIGLKRKAAEWYGLEVREEA